MKKRILLMCPSPNDGTSFWRGAGPFSHLEKTLENDHVEMMLYKGREIGWSDMTYFDAVFVQRPHNDGHVKMMRLAKDVGLKIWADYDDDLTSLPYSNPAYRHYADIDIQKNLSWIAANVDAISVSTEALKTKYAPFKQKITVIPNAWNEIIAPERARHSCEEKIIFWRGSNTHDQDLDHYLPQMGRVAEEHPDWKWVFVGGPYWKITQVIEKHSMIPAFDVPAFLKFIGHLNPSIAIVPLAPHAFNQSKSNIAWQEASFAGACSVVPDWVEWHRPGALLYSSEAADSFYKTLKKAISMTPIERQKAARESWEHIQDKESLKLVSKLRAQVLESLFS